MNLKEVHFKMMVISIWEPYFFQVNSCRAIADQSLTSGSLTACYEERKRNGLVTRHGILELMLAWEPAIQKNSRFDESAISIP